MIKIEKCEVVGFEQAIRGMRNPMNSWDKMDSGWTSDGITEGDIIIDSDKEGWFELKIGPNDQKLMQKLAKGGPVHAKFRRMIVVYVDITAPLYWWKEFDTYKVGTVANSCSTMHKIHAKEFTLDDFSHEHLTLASSRLLLDTIICALNAAREGYLTCQSNFVASLEKNARTKLELEEGKKTFWWQMIQLLPSSYNQKRTIMLNYEVLAGLYPMRKDHKLDEWRDFCNWIQTLPLSELIIGQPELEFLKKEFYVAHAEKISKENYMSTCLDPENCKLEGNI